MLNWATLLVTLLFRVSGGCHVVQYCLLNIYTIVWLMAGNVLSLLDQRLYKSIVVL